MKIEYICHSALLVDTGDLKILTDPWLKGPAYCHQWHLFPKPLNIRPALKADVILLSHGHDDHLHDESLRMLDRNSRIFYPLSWQKSIRPYLGGMGYFRVSAAMSHRSYELSATARLTYITHALQSIMVIESGREVLVNMNNALASANKNEMDIFIATIKKRWPIIDYLFCGYGAASYFPNTVHCEGKNDREVAEAREQLACNNFCYIVHELAPKNTIPFAADYVLLNEEKRWINRVKFTKGQVRDYYFNVYKGRDTNFIGAHPGDRLQRSRFLKMSGYHALENRYSLDQLIDAAMQEEIVAVNEIASLDEEQVDILERKLYAHVKSRSALFSPAILSVIKYTVEVKDIAEKRFFFINCSAGEVRVTRTHEVNTRSILKLQTTSRILDYSLAGDRGGEAIVIGSGAEITILDKTCLDKNLDLVCISLLTGQLNSARQMRALALQALKSFVFNPAAAVRTIMNMIGAGKPVNKNLAKERNLWLCKSKREICRACHIPFLSDEFAGTTQARKST